MQQEIRSKDACRTQNHHHQKLQITNCSCEFYVCDCTILQRPRLYCECNLTARRGRLKMSDVSAFPWETTVKTIRNKAEVLASKDFHWKKNCWGNEEKICSWSEHLKHLAQQQTLSVSICVAATDTKNSSFLFERKNKKTKFLCLLWMCNVILLKHPVLTWTQQCTCRRERAGHCGWLDLKRLINNAIYHKCMWYRKSFFSPLYTICWITCPQSSLIQVRQHNQSLSQCLQSTYNCSCATLPLLALWIAYGMGRGLRVSTLRLHPPAIIRIYKCGIWTVFEGR